MESTEHVPVEVSYSGEERTEAAANAPSLAWVHQQSPLYCTAVRPLTNANRLLTASQGGLQVRLSCGESVNFLRLP